MIGLFLLVSLAGVPSSVSLDVCTQALEARPQSPDNYSSAFDAAARRHHLTPEQRLKVADDCSLIASALVTDALSALGRRLTPTHKR